MTIKISKVNNRTPGVLIVNHQTLQVIMVQPCLALSADVHMLDTLSKNVLQGTVDGRCYRGRLCKSWKGNIKQWIGQSLSSSLHITGERSQWARVAAEATVRVPQ